MTNETLREEILVEASRRFPASGYGQDDLLDVVFELIEKRLNELDEEYKLKVQDAKYRTGYYNALLDVRDILK